MAVAFVIMGLPARIAIVVKVDIPAILTVIHMVTAFMGPKTPTLGLACAQATDKARDVSSACQGLKDRSAAQLDGLVPNTHTTTLLVLVQVEFRYCTSFWACPYLVVAV